MNAWQYNDNPEAPDLSPGGTRLGPAPGPGELLIRVHAAGVTPRTELLWHPTTHGRDGGRRTAGAAAKRFSPSSRRRKSLQASTRAAARSRPRRIPPGRQPAVNTPAGRTVARV